MRVPQLDGLRGLAIFLVLVWHYIVNPQPVGGPISGLLFSLTWSGVDLFFVLSGFLIGGILMDNQKANNIFSVFYFRRAMRILPLYFILLAPFFVIYAISNGKTIKTLIWLFSSPFPLWSYATFMQNFIVVKAHHFGANWLGVTWSLAIEEQFYLIMPFIVWIFPKKRLSYFLIISIVAAFISRICFLVFINNPSALYASSVLLPSRADSLMFGVLGAWMMRQPEIVDKLKKDPNRLDIPLLILGIGMFIYSSLDLPTGHILSLTIGFTWIAAFYFILILYAVIRQDNFFVKNILCNGILGKLGMVSYFVYLFHEVFLGLFHALILNQRPQHNNIVDVSVTILAFFTTITLSAISFRFLEKPFIHYGHRKAYQTYTELRY